MRPKRWFERDLVPQPVNLDLSKIQEAELHQKSGRKHIFRSSPYGKKPATSGKYNDNNGREVVKTRYMSLFTFNSDLSTATLQQVSSGVETRYQAKSNIEKQCAVDSQLTSRIISSDSELPAPGQNVVQEVTFMTPQEDEHQRSRIKSIIAGRTRFNVRTLAQFYKFQHCIHRGNYGFSLRAEYNNGMKCHDVILKFVQKANQLPDFWIYDERRGHEVPLELQMYESGKESNLPMFHEYFDLHEYGVVVTKIHSTPVNFGPFSLLSSTPNVDWQKHHESLGI